MKIAVIDDEIDICFILEYELKALGHTPYTFTSVTEAQSFLSKNQVDLIISDLLQPTMDGIEFFDWLKSDGNKAPFILLTGDTDIDAANLIKQGVFKVLYKPRDILQIRTIMQQFTA